MELKNVCYKNIFKDLNYTFVNTKIYGIYVSSFFKTDLLFEIINGSIKIDNKGIIKNCANIFTLNYNFRDQISNLTVKEEIFGNKVIDNSILENVALDESILDKNPFDLDDLLLPRVIMATMLVNDPDIILVNNIFSKLSDSNKKILRDLLKRLQFDFKKLVIIADPDVDLLFEISDVSLILDDTIIVAGNKFDIFANTDLLKNYSIDIPHYIEFKNYVKEKKDVDLLYRDRITDIIKDVYDNV